MTRFPHLRQLCVALLLCFGASCNYRATNRALNKAIRSRDTAKAASLLKDKGTDVNAVDERGITPLLQSLMSKDKKIYRMLLERGADPNQCDRLGKCAMNQAAEESDPFWLQEALKHGGNPDAINTGNPQYPNSTPIFYALSKGHVAHVKVLLQAGADVNHRDGHGTTPLRAAAEAGKYDSVFDLLQANADPKLADKHGKDITDWFNGRDEGLVLDADQI